MHMRNTHMHNTHMHNTHVHMSMSMSMFIVLSSVAWQAGGAARCNQ